MLLASGRVAACPPKLPPRRTFRNRPRSGFGASRGACCAIPGAPGYPLRTPRGPEYRAPVEVKRQFRLFRRFRYFSAPNGKKNVARARLFGRNGFFWPPGFGGPPRGGPTNDPFSGARRKRKKKESSFSALFGDLFSSALFVTFLLRFGRSGGVPGPILAPFRAPPGGISGTPAGFCRDAAGNRRPPPVLHLRGSPGVRRSGEAV